jgi:tetratricopeptide (TPR) repeat protein
VIAPGRRCLQLGVGLTVLSLALASWRGSVPLPQLRQERYAQLSAAPGGRPDAQFWADLRRAMLAFPADPYFPLIGSSAALASGRNAIPWISRSLERAPRLSEAHLQLARILKSQGAVDQALGAMRRAVDLDRRKSKPVLSLGLAWGLSPLELRKAVPEGEAGSSLLQLLARREPEPSTRLAWLEDVVRRAPQDADGHYWLAVELLADLKRGDAAVACRERAACIARAREHARRGERAGDPRVVILLADVEVQAGNPHAAEQGLREGCTRFPGNAGCHEAIVALALANDSPELTASVRRLVASGCTTQEACGQTHLAVGHLFARAGRLNTALGHYEHATREAPSPDAWRALGDVAGRLGYSAIQTEARRRMQLLEAGERRAPAPEIGQASALQEDRAAELPAPAQASP